MIACCGIECDQCPALQATLANDDQMRAETATEWSKQFGADITQEMVNCTGCTADGVKFIHCLEGCKIRACSLERGFKTCAECNEYACEQLEEFFGMAPGVRENLDKLRHS
ncbi:MAG: DUF3795 domain-containing protein [Candidatus Delongbacteria bacterium]|nr:DUF3795 domain-containing protein [Candidatus Delongbacteria bacterium]